MRYQKRPPVNVKGARAVKSIAEELVVNPKLKKLLICVKYPSGGFKITRSLIPVKELREASEGIIAKPSILQKLSPITPILGSQLSVQTELETLAGDTGINSVKLAIFSPSKTLKDIISPVERIVVVAVGK